MMLAMINSAKVTQSTFHAKPGENSNNRMLIQLFEDRTRNHNADEKTPGS